MAIATKIAVFSMKVCLAIILKYSNIVALLLFQCVYIFFCIIDVAVNVKCLNEDDSEDNVLGNFLGMDGDRMSYSGGLAYNSDSEMNDIPVVAVNGDDDAGSSNNHGTIWSAPPGLSIMSSGMGDGDMYQGAYDGDDSMNNSLDGMMGTDPTEMTAARLYNCEMCDKSFNHEKSLKDHQKRHLGITYKCEMCFKVFTEKKNLRKHQYSHVGNNFYCPECEEGFEEKIHLIRHSLQHVNKQSYLCEGCEQVLVAMPNLNIHNETCHSSVQMFYICILCHFRCSDIEQLTLHHDYHTVKPKKTKTPTKGRRAVGHQCPDCEHVAESSAALKLHRETEHKGIKYYCEKCSKSYSSLNSLRKHKCQIVAPPLPKPTKFECEICGKIFPRIYSKNRHMLSHSNEKKFPCVLCDKKFNRSDKFLQHLRIKHHIDRALYDETISRVSGLYCFN